MKFTASLLFVNKKEWREGKVLICRRTPAASCPQARAPCCGSAASPRAASRPPPSSGDSQARADIGPEAALATFYPLKLSEITKKIKNQDAYQFHISYGNWLTLNLPGKQHENQVKVYDGRLCSLLTPAQARRWWREWPPGPSWRATASSSPPYPASLSRLVTDM